MKTMHSTNKNSNMRSDKLRGCHSALKSLYTQYSQYLFKKYRWVLILSKLNFLFMEDMVSKFL